MTVGMTGGRLDVGGLPGSSGSAEGVGRAGRFDEEGGFGSEGGSGEEAV